MLIAKLEIRIEDTKKRDLTLDLEAQVEQFLADLQDQIYDAIEDLENVLPDGYEVKIDPA